MVVDDGDESILEEAQRLTHGARNADYGHPLDDYTRTAALISALFAHKLKEPLDAADAAQIQILVKLSRHQNVRKRDNMVDLAGYGWVAWACTEEERRRAAVALDDVSDDPVHRALSATFTYEPPKVAPPPDPNTRILPCGCRGRCDAPLMHNPQPLPTGPTTIVPKGTTGPKDPSGRLYADIPGGLAPLPIIEGFDPAD